MMNRQQRKELRRLQSTRQLMGITEITEYGAKTAPGELAFFLIRPDNLTVLPPDGTRSRIRSLTNLLSGMESARLLALNSRESFQNNKIWYQQRLEQETSLL